MNRREALKVGATVAAAPAVIPAAAPAETWKPALFNQHQNATVVALTDLIIPATDTPGAKEANVHRYIDLLLKDGQPPERDRFLQGLAWLDEYSKAQHKEAFVKLPKATQTVILKTLDAGGNPGLEEGRQFFRMAKSLTSRIYYNTAIGFREMNKGGRTPSSFACSHPAKHA